MKNSVKRLLASLLVAVMLFGMAPIESLTGINLSEIFCLNAKAANSYNASAALAYAAAHATDTPSISGADCANFVSKCLTAGGISVSQPLCKNLYNSVLPYGEAYELETVLVGGIKYVPVGGNNATKLEAGDIIFTCCNKCPDKGNNFQRHVVMYSGYSDNRGYAKCYAHTSMANNTLYYCCYKSGLACSNGHGISDVTAYVIHFGGSSSANNTSGNQPATITHSGLNYPNSIKQGDAYYFKGTVSATQLLKTVGIQITNSSGNTVSYASKTINPYSYSVDIASKLDSYIHMSQLPAGTYTYRLFASCKYQVSSYTTTCSTLLTKSFKVTSSGSTSSGDSGYVSIPEASDDLDWDWDEFVDLEGYSTGTYKITAKSGLNSRTGPGKNYAIADNGYAKDETVVITQISGNWGKCNQGWICLEYAEWISSSTGSSGGSSSGSSGGSSGGSSSSSSSSGNYKPGYYVVTAKIGLNSRTGPSQNYSIAGNGYGKGETVAVYEVNGNWGKCDQGWICLIYTTYQRALEPVVNVPAAPQLARSTSEHIARGTAVAFSWSPAADAEVYDVYIKNSSGTVVQELKDIKGHSAVFNMNTEGSYTAVAYSRNSKYTSVSSNSVSLVVHAPSTVEFKDWDGRVLSSQVVAYGSSATSPGNPSRYGWTFERWEGNYNSVTENRTITAQYKRNVYTVSFVNEKGEVIDKQKVEFEGAAVTPDYTAPQGYTFMGWDKDYDYIESNLTIKPVNLWSNEDLPVEISKTGLSAKRSNAGYLVTVNVINNPNKGTDGRLIVALKTAEDKLLVTTESAAFHLSAAANEGELGETKTIEVYVPYKGLATKAEIFVVETFAAAIPISEYATVNIDPNDEWTEWSTRKLASGEYSKMETRTEYRYRNKQYTTSSSSSKSGWTHYKTTSAWGDYGAWSGWTDSYIAGSDSRQVETQSVIASSNYRTNYHYYRWRNANYSSGNHTQDSNHPYWQEVTLDYPLTETSWGGGYKWWHNGSNYYTMWKCADWSESVFVSHNYKTQYRYRDRSLVYTYYYWKWSDWSAWSTVPVTGTSEKQVETRTVYRYQIADNSVLEDTNGETRTISGKVDASLAGEQAILFIYKVDEASDFTNEYVGQTQIADDGSYSFTFKLREEPSIKTGDFTVTLGIEGMTEIFPIDTIESKEKPQYTVEFKDWDGSVISTQTVEEGQSATMPETSPTREGYDFICWNSTATNIKDDLVVSPVYRIKTYKVVFVDWANETVEMHTYEHGQPLMAPELKSTNESVLTGWDTDVDNVLVTEDMIITSKYEAKKFMVTFLNPDNTVFKTETVEYGDSVTLPESIENENVNVFDWETESSTNYITEDLIVVPVYTYKETVSEPTASVVTGEYSGSQTVSLSCETENAVIYYTLDGTDPIERGIEYTGPFTINESYELRFAACAFEMNNSESISEFIAINNGGVNDKHIVTLYGHCFYDGYYMLVDNGSIITLPESVEMEGYNYIGVYKDSEYTDEWNVETDTVTESTVLYVKWEPQTYNVTFMGMENEIISEQQVAYGELAEIPFVETIEGYVFCGFDKSDMCIMEDTVFTAKFIPEDEFVTVLLNRSKYKLFKGTAFTLKATTSNESEKDNVFWVSSDENVVVVDDNGKVTAVGTGTAEVYAISNATGYAATCKVTVMANIDEDITLRDDSDYGFDSEGQLRGVSVSNNTVNYVAEQFENLDLVFVDINGNTLSGNDLVGTGTKVQILNGEEVVDEVVVVVTGDYNGDGYINNRDASMITRYLVDKEYATLTQLTAIDVNGDGYVNNRDASMVSRYLVGKEKI